MLTADHIKRILEILINNTEKYQVYMRKGAVCDTVEIRFDSGKFYFEMYIWDLEAGMSHINIEIYSNKKHKLWIQYPLSCEDELLKAEIDLLIKKLRKVCESHMEERVLEFISDDTLEEESL